MKKDRLVKETTQRTTAQLKSTLTLLNTVRDKTKNKQVGNQKVTERSPKINKEATTKI